MSFGVVNEYATILVVHKPNLSCLVYVSEDHNVAYVEIMEVPPGYDLRDLKLQYETKNVTLTSDQIRTKLNQVVTWVNHGKLRSITSVVEIDVVTFRFKLLQRKKWVEFELKTDTATTLVELQQSLKMLM
jgi:hypothetical protein